MGANNLQKQNFRDGMRTFEGGIGPVLNHTFPYRQEKICYTNFILWRPKIIRPPATYKFQYALGVRIMS